MPKPFKRRYKVVYLVEIAGFIERRSKSFRSPRRAVKFANKQMRIVGSVMAIHGFYKPVYPHQLKDFTATFNNLWDYGYRKSTLNYKLYRYTRHL